ncbi:low temperature requirement protein A [Deinococcus sp. UYEF24]
MTRSSLKLRPLQERGRGRHASWLELFFDLVFVASIAQIAHQLDQINLAHLLAFVGLLSMLWWTWLGYTFYADFFENGALPYRLAMFIAMFGVIGLAVNAGVVRTSGGMGFAVSAVIVHGVLVLLYQQVSRAVPVAGQFAGLALQTYGVSGLIWLASVFTPPPWRFWLWALALIFEIVNSLRSNRITRTMPFDADHIAERLGLFTVLVLGEAVLSLTRGLSPLTLGLQTTLTALAGFGVVALLWWLYFELTEVDVAGHGWSPRFLVFLYAHLPLSLGVVTIGAGLGKTLAVGPAGPDSQIAGALVAVGTALTLVTLTVLSGAARSVHFWIVRVLAALLLLGLPLVLPTPAAVLLAVLGILLIAVSTEITVTGRLASSPGPEGAGLEVDRSNALATSFGGCEHLLSAHFTSTDTHVCQDCLQEGTTWVELRLCLVCGAVGCCDSSERQHAAAHFRATRHPVMRSIEPDEVWGWCYLDQRFIDVPAAGLPGDT